jgi:tellurite resistance protein
LPQAQQAEHEGRAFEVHESDITQEVLQELEALNIRGQLSHLVTPWDPWWHADAAAALQLNTAGQRVVQDMQHLHQQVQQQQLYTAGAWPSSSTAREQSGIPLPCEEPLPSMQQLAGLAHRPSELLPWQLLQLLVAYCAVMRQYNGEPEAEEGWKAAQQMLLLAPPLVQAALASSRSAGSSVSKQADAVGQAQPQQQQQQAGLSIFAPASVRGACIQLLDAAAAADAATSSSQLQQQLAAAAAAISSSGGGAPAPERRALLQVATADALKLLQLGRSAVVLALTDSRRLLVRGKDCVKLSLQQHSGKGQHLQRQRRQLQQLRQGLSLAGQKVWYFMVWCNEQVPVVYQVLAKELGCELQGQQAMAQPATGVSLTGKPDLASKIEPIAQKPVVVMQSVAQSASQSWAATDSPVAELAANPAESGSYGLYELD